MRKVKFFASLTALMTLSVAALTACTTAEASTHHTVSQTGGESVHSSRLDAILERGYIEVATEPSFAPNEFIDTTKTGQDRYAGSDIQLANYIANELGVELRLKPMDFTTVLGSITSGKYDLAISALAYTPERAEAMNLSKGYYFGSEDPPEGLRPPDPPGGCRNDHRCRRSKKQDHHRTERLSPGTVRKRTAPGLRKAESGLLCQ